MTSILDSLKGHFSTEAQENKLFGHLFTDIPVGNIKQQALYDYINDNSLINGFDVDLVNDIAKIDIPYDSKSIQMIYIPPDKFVDESDDRKYYEFIFHLYQLYVKIIKLAPHDVDIDSISITEYDTATPFTVTNTSSASSDYKDHALLNNHLHFINQIRTEKGFYEKLFVYLCAIKLKYVVYLEQIIKNMFDELDINDDNNKIVIYNKNTQCLDVQIAYIYTVYFVGNMIDNVASIIGLPIQYNPDGNNCRFKVTGDNFVNTIFSNVDASKHVVYDMTNKKVYDIQSNTQVFDDGGINYITLNSCPDAIKDSNILLKITYRPINYYKNKYDENVDTVKMMNKKMIDNKDKHTTAMTDDKHLQATYNGINTVYYITIFAIIVVVMGLSAGNNNVERSIIDLVLLVAVIVLYVIFLLRYSNIELFENFTVAFTYDDEKRTFDTKANTLIDTINFYTPIVTLKDVYQEMLHVINKDIQSIKKSNNIINTQTTRIENKTTGDWHDYYSKAIFIHTAVMLMIIAILFQWLYSNFPSIDFMLIVFTSIAVLIVMFNYFRNIYKIVRTDHKNMYWTKMKNI